MFLADATFEVTKKANPTDPRIEGMQFRMSLVSLCNVREVNIVLSGRFATYSQIVDTLTNVLPDWALIAGQVPELSRQHHTLQFESREEVDAIIDSLM